MTMTKSTDLTGGKIEITAYLNKTTGQPEFAVPESDLVLNLAAATQLLKSNSDKIILLNGIKRSCLDDFILRDEAFRDDNAFVINTKHTENGRLVCSVDGKRIAIRKAAQAAIEAHHSNGLITILRNEYNDTCILSENFMMLGDWHVEVAIRQFGEGAPVKGSCVLNDETCRVWSPEEVLVEKNLNAESNSEHEIELEKKFAAEEAREEKRLKAREITAKLNIKLQTLPLENLTLTAPDGITRTVPKKEIYFVTFFTPEPQLELINDDGITFAKFSSAAEAQAALDKFNENNLETETNSDVPLAYPQAFQKFTYHMKSNRPVFGAVPGGYVSLTKGEIKIPCKRADGTISPAKKTVFNTLVYDRVLTDEEILDYDLVPNPFNPTEKTLSELPKSDKPCDDDFIFDEVKTARQEKFNWGSLMLERLKYAPRSEEADDPTGALEAIPIPEKEVDVFDLLPSLEELNEVETETEKPLNKLEELRLKVSEARRKVAQAKAELEAALEEQLLEECLACERAEEAERERRLKLEGELDERFLKMRGRLEAIQERCRAMDIGGALEEMREYGELSNSLKEAV